MIQALKALPRELAALLTLGASALVALVLIWLVSVLGLTVDALNEVERHEPRIARLLGYEQAAPRLTEASLRAEQALGQLVFPASAGEQAGAQLQQVLRRYAEQAGLQVTGSQLVKDETDSEEGQDPLFEKLGVELSLVGRPMALDAFLISVASHGPTLATAFLELQKPRQQRARRNAPGIDPELLNVRLKVLALQTLES